MLLGFPQPKEALVGGVLESCLKPTYTPFGPQEICVYLACQISECLFSAVGPSPLCSSPSQEGTNSRTTNSLQNQTSVWRIWLPFPQVPQMWWILLLAAPSWLEGGNTTMFLYQEMKLEHFSQHGADFPQSEWPKWERAKQKLYPFYDFASKVTQHHFCHILSVRISIFYQIEYQYSIIVPNDPPSREGEWDSPFWKKEGQGICGCILKSPHSQTLSKFSLWEWTRINQPDSEANKCLTQKSL